MNNLYIYILVYNQNYWRNLYKVEIWTRVRIPSSRRVGPHFHIQRQFAVTYIPSSYTKTICSHIYTIPPSYTQTICSHIYTIPSSYTQTICSHIYTIPSSYTQIICSHIYTIPLSYTKTICSHRYTRPSSFTKTIRSHRYTIPLSYTKTIFNTIVRNPRWFCLLFTTRGLVQQKNSS